MAICLLTTIQQSVFSGTTSCYSSPSALEAASSSFTGDRVNLSFNTFPVAGMYASPFVISNIAILGRTFVIEPVSGVPFLYLNNYDSDVPLTIHFPTGAKAFGAFFSSWLGPSYPKTFTMTATTDHGEVFTFEDFSSYGQSPPVNVAWFGLIPDAPIYDLTLSDGGIVQSGGYSMHEEMIAELFAVINRPPALDVSGLLQSEIGVNGSAGQTIVLLTSTNLIAWQAIVTNRLASDRWVYSATQTNSASARFYRVAAY